jgi:hypothetical protein
MKNYEETSRIEEAKRGLRDDVRVTYEEHDAVRLDWDLDKIEDLVSELSHFEEPYYVTNNKALDSEHGTKETR